MVQYAHTMNGDSALRSLFAKSFEAKMLLFVPEFLFRCTDHFEDIRIACR